MASLVLAATSDLFLQSRIAEAVRPLGLAVKFVNNIDQLVGAAGTARPELVVIDLSSTEDDPFSSARALKSSFPTLKILGFFPHVRTELAKQGRESGIDYIVPNSGLLETIRKILSTRAGC